MIQDWFGLAVCLAGGVCQIAVGRRLKINPVLNGSAVGVAVALQLTIREYLFPSLLDRLSIALYYWVPSVLQTWFICLTSVWILVRLREHAPPFRESRRRFLRASGAAVCAAPPAVALFGILTRNDFEVKEQSLVIPNLAADLRGLRIVHFSDLHVGPFFSLRQWERVIDAANEFRADLAFVTGDLITTARDPLEECIQRMAGIKATAGIYGCHGNHEEFCGLTGYATRLGERFGIRFLRREAVALRFGEHKMNLVGVDYQPFRTPYLTDVESMVSATDLNVLLSHNPDVFPVAAEMGFDLVLSGHTHGGQVNVEILHQQLDIARFFTPYVKGLYRQGGSSAYVSAGLGTIGIPVRLGARPEVTLHTLCAS